MSCPAFALDIGYGVARQTPTDPVPHADSGLELRAVWGGEHRDRWSAWLGTQPERSTKDGVAYKLGVDQMPGYAYAAFLRRFNKRLDGPVTLFAGTGIGYRDLETCVAEWSQYDRRCFGGDAFISSRWAFAQELGFRWKVVEVSIGHFSTGGVSHFNHGINLFRFTLMWGVGQR